MEMQEKQLHNIFLKLESLTEDVKKLLVDKSEHFEDIKVESSITECDDLPDKDYFQKHKSENSVVRLNVDGSVFSISWTEMCQYPESRLGRLGEALSIQDILQLCDNYNAKDNEFYFKKKNKNFGEIREFYRTGSFHISDDNCVIAFDQELQYWGIPSSFLETCCYRKLMDAKEMLKKQDDDLEGTTKEQFPPGSRGRVQKYLWNLFEYPHSSLGAQLVGIISVTSIILSIIILTLDTFPHFQKKRNKLFGDYIVFAIMEAIYMAWFTFEFLIRLICCPSKLRFIKQFINWIDLLAILPYFIMLALHISLLSDPEDSSLSETVIETNNGRYRKVPQVFRLLRILRILRFIARFFKLARHSIGLQALGYTLKSKYKELCLVLLFLGMGAIIFSSIIFVFESNVKGSEFKTMLDGYWWAVITMTTVGYGDISPVTRMGKVIGTLCAVFGVLVVALPIPIIGTTFNQYYDREKKRQKFLTREASEKDRGHSKVIRKTTREEVKDCKTGKYHGKTNNGFHETPP